MQPETQRFVLLEFLARSYDNAEKSELLAVVDGLGFDLNLAEGPWVAGGAVRRTLAGKGVSDSDVDLFFASAEQLASCRAALEAKGGKQKRESEHNIEYAVAIGESEYRVQFIRISFYSSPEAVIDSFDFTICQFVTDGKDVICGPYSLWDLSRKRLVVHKITYAVASMRRALKYAGQGFTVCGGAITRFLNGVLENPAIVRADVKYID
jgi:hypothetical protein